MHWRWNTEASASFSRQRQRLWNNHNVSMRVRGKIYRAIVLSIFLYGAEAWTVNRRQVKKMHAFMVRHLRSIMRIINLDEQSDKQGKYSNGQGCHLWKIFWSERISSGQDTSWGCYQPGYQRHCLLVTAREGTFLSGSRIPSRETWSWER